MVILYPKRIRVVLYFLFLFIGITAFAKKEVIEVGYRQGWVREGHVEQTNPLTLSAKLTIDRENSPDEAILEFDDGVGKTVRLPVSLSHIDSVIKTDGGDGNWGFFVDGSRTEPARVFVQESGGTLAEIYNRKTKSPLGTKTGFLADLQDFSKLPAVQKSSENEARLHIFVADEPNIDEIQRKSRQLDHLLDRHFNRDKKGFQERLGEALKQIDMTELSKLDNNLLRYLLDYSPPELLHHFSTKLDNESLNNPDGQTFRALVTETQFLHAMDRMGLNERGIFALARRFTNGMVTARQKAAEAAFNNSEKFGVTWDPSVEEAAAACPFNKVRQAQGNVRNAGHTDM